MGFWDFVDGLLQRGADEVSAGINRNFQRKEAQKNRDFQLDMYERQLDDNIAWRTHQEQYNTPEAQMSRYRDAGINPMYAITGSGMNTVVSPMNMSGGYGTGTPSGSSLGRGDSKAVRQFNLEKDVAQKRLANETNVANSQVEMNKASSRRSDAEARLLNANARAREFDNEVYDYLGTLKFEYDGKSVDYNGYRAEIEADAQRYKSVYQGLSFEDAKQAFAYSKAVREFEQGLLPQKREKFMSELRNAKNAEEVGRVAKEWAVANQWINAGSQLIGAAAGFVGAVKGTSFAPIHTESESRTFSKRVGNEIQSPESMMRIDDIE